MTQIANPYPEVLAARDDLEKFLASLRQAREPAEGAFLAVGENLIRAVGLLQRTTDAVTEMSTRLGGDEFEEAFRGLSEAATEVAALASSANGDKSGLGDLDGQIHGVRRGIERFRGTIAEVEMLAVNAKIQVAHLPVTNDDFISFTRDMEKLARSAGDGLALLAEKLEALAQSVRKALGSRDVFEKENRQSLSAIGERLGQALESVRRRRSRATATATALGQRSRDVGARINVAVGALQINDITRQRLEHVEEILEEASDVAAGGHGWGAELSGEDRRQMFATVCKLQSAQVLQANDHFVREVRQLIDSLDSLARSAGDIEAESRAAAGQALTAGGRGTTSFMGDLEDQLADAAALLANYARAESDTAEVVRSASAAVADMLVHVETVQSIEADMRIMGLNATLKCGRLGAHGRALSVVAQELRNCAGQTRYQAAQVEAGLNRMIAAAQTLGGGHGGVGTLSAVMERSSAVLNELGAAFDRILSGLAADTAEVKGILADTRDGIGIHEIMGPSLREFAHRIESLCGADLIDADRLNELKERVLARLGARYTMESERLMHELVLGGAPESAPEGPATPADVDPDDFLF